MSRVAGVHQSHSASVVLRLVARMRSQYAVQGVNNPFDIAVLHCRKER
jgi:hypothetical protein